MYTHILISTDGSALAQRGVDHGLSLASALGSKVTIITVTEPLPIMAISDGVAWPVDLTGYEADRRNLQRAYSPQPRRRLRKCDLRSTPYMFPIAIPPAPSSKPRKNWGAI